MHLVSTTRMKKGPTTAALNIMTVHAEGLAQHVMGHDWPKESV